MCFQPLFSVRADVLHVHCCMRHTEYDRGDGAPVDAGESDFMYCIHWPLQSSTPFPGSGCILVEALPGFAVAERPLPFRLPRDCIACSLLWLMQETSACIACRIASEKSLQDSFWLLDIGFDYTSCGPILAPHYC